MAAAAATVAASAAFGLGDVLVGRHVAKLERERDKFADFPLEGFEFALGIHEIDGHRVVEKLVASTFEVTDLAGTQLDAGVLLLVKRLAALVNRLVLEFRGFVGEKPLNGFLKFSNSFVGGDFRAKFAGFLDDAGFGGSG